MFTQMGQKLKTKKNENEKENVGCMTDTNVEDPELFKVDMTEQNHIDMVENFIPWGQSYSQSDIECEEVFEVDQLLMDRCKKGINKSRERKHNSEAGPIENRGRGVKRRMSEGEITREIDYNVKRQRSGVEKTSANNLHIVDHDQPSALYRTKDMTMEDQTSMEDQTEDIKKPGQTRHKYRYTDLD